MPSSHYRRRLRNNSYNSYHPTYIETKYNFITNTGECDIVKIHQAFYNIIDLIIEQFNFTEAVISLQGIINRVQEKVDYYNIIDTIENNLLSVASNILDGASINIITTRINYIKSFIDTLPASSALCDDLGPVSDMILDILNLMISTNNFDDIRQNINHVHTLLTTSFPNITVINLIQDNLLQIICNIKDNIGYGIIHTRINYVQGLIKQIILSE
jgi:hypothetical protein